MKSRRSSDRRRGPEPQPEFLIDRSLSQVSLPAALREAGLIVHTLAEIYGEKHAQAVEDTEWIALAAERDLVVFCKDDHIRRRPAERQALLDGNVRVFCLTNARLNFAEQASYFVSNRFRILQACKKPGPYVYGIYQDRITRLWLDAK